MCTSIADGGKQCFSHHRTGNRSSSEIRKAITTLKTKYKKTKMSIHEYQEQIKSLKVDYFTTEQGIQDLEREGKFEHAERFRIRRNKKIDNYNKATSSSLAHFPSYQERQSKLDVQFDSKGFHRKTGIHRSTGSSHNELGFNKSGIHKVTGTRFSTDGYDSESYAKDGFHRTSGLNRQGFGRDGFHTITNLDSGGFNRQGFRAVLGTELDRDGYQRNGFNIKGIHKTTGTPYDVDGFDEENYHGQTGEHRDSGLTRQQEWQLDRTHIGNNV